MHYKKEDLVVLGGEFARNPQEHVQLPACVFTSWAHFEGVGTTKDPGSIFPALFLK